MKPHWIKTPGWLAWLLPQYEWRKSKKEKIVYLTFDDGPIPEVTPFVLDKLKEYGAKGTFFCIGDNVVKHPEIFERLISEGHAIGNHTFHHVKGWETPLDAYLKEVSDCADVIRFAHPPEHKLMRPPYAKITFSQTKKVREMGYRIILWDVLSEDYDQSVSPEKCLENVVKHVRPGSIVIFHDSLKAYPNMKFALEGTLEYLKKEGYVCDALY